MLSGEVLSYYFSIISLIVVCLIIIASVWIIFKDEEKLEDSQFQIKYKELYANNTYSTKM